MKVLVVGSGGREHAICMSVAKSKRVDKIYCAPGNAGIGQIAECVPIGAMDFDKIKTFSPMGVKGFVLGTTVLFGKDRSYKDILMDIRSMVSRGK